MTEYKILTSILRQIEHTSKLAAQWVGRNTKHFVQVLRGRYQLTRYQRIACYTGSGVFLLVLWMLLPTPSELAPAGTTPATSYDWYELAIQIALGTILALLILSFVIVFWQRLRPERPRQMPQPQEPAAVAKQTSAVLRGWPRPTRLVGWVTASLLFVWVVYMVVPKLTPPGPELSGYLAALSNMLSNVPLATYVVVPVLVGIFTYHFGGTQWGRRPGMAVVAALLAVMLVTVMLYPDLIKETLAMIFSPLLESPTTAQAVMSDKIPVWVWALFWVAVVIGLMVGRVIEVATGIIVFLLSI